MSDKLFDYTFNIKTEEAQNAALSAIAAAGKKEYEPISHFFVDETKLATIVAANYATDAFGPVTGSLTTKYRTTSVVRATGADPVKVFAICNGQILLQPHYDLNGAVDDTKVNLILKPAASYNPLKIKYFIYRGVRKEDLMDAANNIKVESTDVNQPSFIKKLWFQFINFYTDADNTAPTVFPASLIGYDPSLNDTVLIDHAFSKKGTDKTYQLPLCSSGEYIANFMGSIGLDIVLDYGDYHLENQEELFKLDLKYTRKNEHVFDTVTVTNAVKIKRYKEHIHQFLDAAAFWGSHIMESVISHIELSDATKIKTTTDIFTKILNKYQTQNKIYVYVQGENNRSYSYYEATRKVYGFNTVGQLNETSGWPIIIEELTVTVTTPATTKKGITFSLEYNIDTRIPEAERHVLVDVVTANDNKTAKYPLLEKPKNPVAPAVVPPFLISKTASITISFQVNGTKSCATFLMFYGNLKQEFPLKNYYNDLFPVNFNTNFFLPTTNTENLSSWATYDRSRLVNLDDVIDTGAVIQNKLVLDNGKGKAPSTGGVAPRKARRLYMAVLKRNAIHNVEYDGLNIDTVTAGIATSTTTATQYALNVYNSLDFSVYKGTFTDGTTIVNSLSLLHENSLVKKNSFFHLGIADEEFNKLIYGQITVPAIVLPATTPAQYLPMGADNVFFHLEEVLPFASQNVQKFKVGFRFEDATGTIVTLFPLPANDVFVYTIDGFYFFSKEYSEFHELYNEFAKAKVEFRTVPVAIPASGAIPAVPAYNGEFGFDWLRIGDNGEPSYESTIVGGYERPTFTDINTEYEYSGSASGVFNDAAKALKREYKSIPTQNSNEQYFIPYLNLFSKIYSDSLPATVSPKPPFQATLRVFVEIDVTLSKLEFDYDRALFTIDKSILSDRTATIGKVESIDKTITITCLNDFSETQQIKVLAYPLGVVDKKEAKLAGLITLSKNDGSVRKNVNIVLIKVQTDINNDTTLEKGIFSITEKTNLVNSLHQLFIYPNILENLLYYMPLDGNPDFKSAGTYIDGTGSGPFYIKHNQAGLQDFLRNTFLSLFPVYNDYFTIFSFGIRTKPNSSGGFVVGNVQDIGIHNVNLFDGRGDYTLCHESLHGYGLYHTHKDGTIIEPEIKYVYPNGNTLTAITIANATDNYMSYTGNLRKSTWNWQIKIIRNNIEK